MAAVDDEVVVFFPEWAAANKCGSVVCSRVARVPKSELLLVPSDGQLRQSLANPKIASRIAEKDQVVHLEIIFGDFLVVLDFQVSPKVPAPFIGKTLQVRFGPGLNGWIPGFPGSPHAEERLSEGIIDRALKARTF